MISLLRVAKVFSIPASELIAGIDLDAPRAELEATPPVKETRSTT